MVRPLALLLVTLPLMSLLSACQRLPAPEQSGELVVAIRQEPVVAGVEGQKNTSFERDMVNAFAEKLGVDARFVVAADDGELVRLVKKGKVHFAASSWTSGKDGLNYTSPLLETAQVVVGHTDDIALEADPVELDGHTVEAIEASPQWEALQKLAGTPARFKLQARSRVSDLDVLRDVAEQRVEFAATNLLHYRLGLQFMPELELALTLPGKLRYGWAFAPEAKSLWRQAEDFVVEARGNGTIARFADRYFGNIERIKPDGIARLIQDARTLLHRYRRDFQDAQEITGIDWRLLAAVAYQESKWDPLATSPTGVRGMMMLTEDTADALGVSNRLDPRQSIRAGAKYLASLMEELPSQIVEPDRTWLALAAYNLGMGHLRGGRSLALGLKRDPDSWYEMKKVLPLMSRPEYYARLKAGPARGGEAVIMVENIRTFHSILSRLEVPWQSGFQLSRQSYKPGLKLRPELAQARPTQ
ncbi:membrane-bound lytic murein transglycosylase MltF [Denitratisoma oestradiolicum]|uniref:Peptidoglycan lytic exotransglycosylase n=1 Tax=Denitratisoma oestradiolicum TaxID=311182 RepID=A0A6S6XTZ4_9PROT|nr:membrane-bound lytic murein transglycosylase MltF [Denitratisoma oestradiolicum]TWO79264.1 lytic transglycosylase F [Denitratisoma oestradiolicum]CAB1368270.1 Peptidoglycan lytic exotransglycosylase [Denitratisoma oestradiolicum]